jgi:hypothetical protein
MLTLSNSATVVVIVMVVAPLSPIFALCPMHVTLRVVCGGSVALVVILNGSLEAMVMVIPMLWRGRRGCDSMKAPMRAVLWGGGLGGISIGWEGVVGTAVYLTLNCLDSLFRVI